MKIELRIVHISDTGGESIVYEEDIGKVMNNKIVDIVNKSLDLVKIMQESDEKL
jgi:hypothetical protein